MIDPKPAQQLLQSLVVVVSKEYPSTSKSNDAILAKVRERKSQYGSDILNEIKKSIVQEKDFQEETND